MGKLFNILKFLFAAALFGATALSVGYYSLVVILSNPSQFTEEKIVALVLAFILFVFFSVLFLPLVTFMPERKIRIRVTRTFIGIVLIVFLAYMVIDAPRPEDAYTIEDLGTAEQDPAQLTFLVDALIWEKVGTFEFEELFKEEFYFCSIGQYEAEVLEGWKRLKPYRILIDQLASYDRMSLPSALGNTAIPNYAALRNYVYVYRAFALLQASQGNLDQAVRELSMLQRVIRNGIEGSIGFNQKMAWLEMLQINLETAYQIARSYDLSAGQLEELHSAFSSLDSTVLDGKKASIEDYLAKKNFLDLSFEQKLTNGLLSSSRAYPLENQSLWLQELVYHLTFQRNRTALMLGDKWQSTPDLSPSLTKWQYTLLSSHLEDVLDLEPPIRNLSGWLLFRTSTPAVSEEKSVAPKVMADLFAHYLNDRLGSDQEIRDHFSKEPYRVIEQDRGLVSPGEDKVAGTKDDVVLKHLCLPK